MVDNLTPVELEFEKSIPFSHEDILRSLCENGVFVVGGFPLWLVGGADYYSDYDLCVLDWKSYYTAHNLLMGRCNSWRKTELSISYMVGESEFQLLKPSTIQESMLDLMCSVDMSPSACVMTYDEKFHVYALYPDDIKARICRMLIKHDWSWYRIETYEKKGYTVIEDIIYDETQISP